MEYLIELERMSSELQAKILDGLDGEPEHLKELNQAFEIINDLISIAYRNKLLSKLK